MKTKYTVPLKTIAEKMHLKPLHLASNYDSALVRMAEVNRPALQLTGFYNYFDPKRVQIIGRVESTYLDTLTHEQRLDAHHFDPEQRHRARQFHDRRWRRHLCICELHGQSDQLRLRGEQMQ